MRPPASLGEGLGLALPDGLTLALALGLEELDGLTLRDADEDAELDALLLAEAEGLCDADGLEDALLDADGDTEDDGLTESDAEPLADLEALALALEDGLTEALGDTDALALPLALAEALEDGETLADGLTLAEALAEALALTELDALGDAEDDGPKAAVRSSVEPRTNDRSGRRCRAPIRTGTIAAPGNVIAAALGEGEGLAELDALLDALALTELEGLSDSDADDDGELTISRTANVTMARSSAVPFVSPTARDPCPGVFSKAPTKHCAPVSRVFVTVELAPFVGGV